MAGLGLSAVVAFGTPPSPGPEIAPFGISERDATKLPPDKRELWEKERAEIEQARNSGRTPEGLGSNPRGLRTPVPPLPAPTGIVEHAIGWKYFAFNNAWVGVQGGVRVNVYAGHRIGEPGKGVVLIRRFSLQMEPIGHDTIIDAPPDAGTLRIIEDRGWRLTLASASGSTFVLDLNAASLSLQADGGSINDNMVLDASGEAGGIQPTRNVSSGNFTIAIEQTLNPEPFQGFQWQIAFDAGVLAPVSATSNDDGNPTWDSDPTGLTLCAPAAIDTGAPAGTTWFGGGAGCAGVSGVSFTGTLARITLACLVSDGSTTEVRFVAPAESQFDFGSTFLTSSGSMMATDLGSSITVRCGP